MPLFCFVFFPVGEGVMKGIKTEAKLLPKQMKCIQETKWEPMETRKIYTKMIKLFYYYGLPPLLPQCVCTFSKGPGYLGSSGCIYELNLFFFFKKWISGGKASPQSILCTDEFYVTIALDVSSKKVKGLMLMDTF